MSSSQEEAQKIGSRKGFIPADTIPTKIYNLPDSFYDLESNTLSVAGEKADELKNYCTMAIADGDFGIRDRSLSEEIDKKLRNNNNLYFIDYGDRADRIYINQESAKILLEDAIIRVKLDRFSLASLEQIAYKKNGDKELGYKSVDEWPDIEFNGRKILGKNIKQRAIKALSRVKLMDVNDMKRRIVIHETNHYIDLASEGVLPILMPLLTEIEKKHREKNKQSLEETMQIYKNDLYNDLKNESVYLSCLGEASSILHEILGQQFIDSSEGMSHEHLEVRFVALLSSMKEEKGKGSTLKNDIKTLIESKDASYMSVHNLGTLLLMFGSQILSEKSDEIYNLSGLIPEDLKTASVDEQANYILIKIFDRIEEISSNIDSFAKSLVDEDYHTLIQVMLNKSKRLIGEKTIKFLDENPEFAPEGYDREKMSEILKLINRIILPTTF